MAVHRPVGAEGRSALAVTGAALCAAASRPWVLAATIIASAMAFIDGSVVTIALPVLQADLDAGLVALQWVVNAYVLFLGALILVGGAACDRFGRRRTFVWGTVVFALGSAGCALAPSVEALIAARMVKGMGAALMVPQSLAIIAAAFPPDERGRAIGTWAGASAIATAAGPALGGVLIESLGWRAAFWINLPLAAAVVAIARAHVPESRGAASGPLDISGAVWACLAAGGLTLGIAGIGDTGGPGLRWAAVAVGLAAAALFLRAERRAAVPLVPLGLFAIPAFRGANLVTLLLYGAFSAVLFLMPFALMGRRGLGAAAVGLVFAPLGVIIGVVSRPAGRLGDRIGPRLPLTVGAALVAAGALLAAAGAEGMAVGVAGPVGLVAFGMALVVAPLTTAVMNAAPEALAGAASGINNAASRLAGLFAVALVGSVAAAVFAAGGPVGARFGVFPEAGRAAVEAAFDRAYAAGMAVAAAAALLAAGLAWTTVPGTPEIPPDQA
jgi:EmrB/QacA subfamily drug resistance transporter